jgi:TPR repeat protein
MCHAYQFGAGVPEDYTKAAEWCRKSADQGVAVAQYMLGDAYRFGKGVRRDYKLAVEWLRKSADQGLDLGQTELGEMYEQGQGVPQDYSAAIEWFRKAAQQGYHEAQRNLGEMYYIGHGVLRNHVIAYALFNLAATNSPVTLTLAVSRRQELAGRLKPEQLAAGQELTRQLMQSGNFLKALDAAADSTEFSKGRR